MSSESVKASDMSAEMASILARLPPDVRTMAKRDVERAVSALTDNDPDPCGCAYPSALDDKDREVRATIAAALAPYADAANEADRAANEVQRGDAADTRECVIAAPLRPHVIRNGKPNRPGSGRYGSLTGDELQAAYRAKRRAQFDAAEYRLIAARALLKAAETEAEADGWPDHALDSVETERECVRSAERILDEARAMCEKAGVVVNAHPATSIL